VDLDTARTQLEQVLRETQDTTEVLEGEGAGESSELTHSDQHPGDTASELSDGDREVALLEATDTRRGEARAALDRLDAGTYGSCVDCGQPIPDERLEFRPEAARCLADQTAYEAAQA
jgi:DnaK suppressor protein